MADESRTNQPEASIHVNHYCCIEGCGKWGGLGFQKNKVEQPVWWCAEHYPYWPENVASKYAAGRA